MGHFINTSSQSSLVFRRFSPPNSSLLRPLFSSSQRYSASKETDQERAPSTLEEFKRLSQEKAEMEKPTVAKAGHKAEEGASAATTDPRVEIHVKEHYKQSVGVGKTGTRDA